MARDFGCPPTGIDAILDENGNPIPPPKLAEIVAIWTQPGFTYEFIDDGDEEVTDE